MALELVQDVGEAYQFPTAIGDYAGTEWTAAAAQDLSHIMIWMGGTDWDKLQYPMGAEFHRVQAPALYHRGTELVCLFQYNTPGVGWQLAVERYPGAFAIAGGEPNPTPNPTPTPSGQIKGPIEIIGRVLITPE